MSLKLEDVKGIGKRVEDLKSAGIDSVEKLANAKVEDLTGIKGIGEASAQKFIESAKDMLGEKASDKSIDKDKVKEVGKEIDKDSDKDKVSKEEEEKKIQEEEEKKIQEEVKKLEEKQKKLQGKKVEKGDFILLKITAKTQKGNVFRVSSIDDAKKAGIYEEKKKHMYSPDFVIVGKPGFLNEGLTETLETMNYFEKKSVRIPPAKAFGKRDPSKIERIGITKFKKMNEGKNPEFGQEFVKKDGNRGVVTNIVQGRVIVDYNHPLAGQTLDYNIEVIDKIAEFNDKIEYFLISKGIPKENVLDFKINYIKENKLIEFTVPKQFLFQNIVFFKFGLAMDLQTHMAEEINDVKFIEIYEKINIPTSKSESVMKKVEEFNQEQEIQKEAEQKENTK